MLHRYVDQRAFPFRFVLFSLISLFKSNSITSFFFPFIFYSLPTYLCCTRRIGAGRALEKLPPSKTAVGAGADSLSYIFLFLPPSFVSHLISRNHHMLHTNRRTTSIGWHIKRKQHLDQSRRDNSYVQTWKRRGRSTTYFRVYLLAWRARALGTKGGKNYHPIYAREKVEVARAIRKIPHPPLLWKNVALTRRRWNTGDISILERIQLARRRFALARLLLPTAFLSPSSNPVSRSSHVVGYRFFFVALFRNNDAAANPYLFDNHLVAVKRTIQSEYIPIYT